MTDFALGLLVGIVLMEVIFLITTRNRVTITKKDEITGETRVFKSTAKKPDNAKARKFADPRYRAAKAEELLTKSPGGAPK